MWILPSIVVCSPRLGSIPRAYVVLTRPSMGPGVARKPGSLGVSDAKIDKTVRGERQADGQRSGCLG